MNEKDIKLKETKQPDNLRKGGRRERNLKNTKEDRIKEKTKRWQKVRKKINKKQTKEKKEQDKKKARRHKREKEE